MFKNIVVTWHFIKRKALLVTLLSSFKQLSYVFLVVKFLEIFNFHRRFATCKYILIYYVQWNVGIICCPVLRNICLVGVTTELTNVISDQTDDPLTDRGTHERFTV